jgi:hypothetical protein
LPVLLALSVCDGYEDNVRSSMTVYLSLKAYAEVRRRTTAHFTEQWHTSPRVTIDGVRSGVLIIAFKNLS